MQGRLSPSLDGEIQGFPVNTWKNEFELLSQLPVMPYYAPDVDTIDWIVPMKGFEENPIFHEFVNINKSVNAVCVDSIIDDRFPDPTFLDTYFASVCTRSVLCGINRITVPLLEKSSVMNEDIRRRFLDYVIDLAARKLPTVYLSFEFEATEEVIDEVLGSHPSFRLTYDTGNFTSYFKDKVNHKKLLTKYKNRIDNIHLKDRVASTCHTVEPGEGDTNFVQIFETLAETDYQKHFTLQTSRGRSGQEMITVSRHLDYFNKIMELMNL